MRVLVALALVTGCRGLVGIHDLSVSADGSVADGPGAATDGTVADVSLTPDATTRDAPAPSDAARPDAAGASFAQAIPLTVSGNASGALGSVTDKVYYKLSLIAGERIQAYTITSASTKPSVIDTVLTLYDDTMTQVAQDDDGWPKFGTDSVLYYIAPASGTYYLVVADCHSLGTGAMCGAVTDLDYTLATVYLSGGGSNHELEASPSQDGTPANAQEITYSVPSGLGTGEYGLYILDGIFAKSLDEQVFGFVPPLDTVFTAGTRPRAEIFLEPIGPTDGDGSTASATVWITDDTGSKTLGQLNGGNFTNGDDPADGPADLSVPVTLGQQYYVFIANNTGEQGYYFAVHSVGSGSSGHLEDEGPMGTGANDSMMFAQKLPLDDGALYAVDGDLPTESDVDWFEVDPPATATTGQLSCRAHRLGSGLLGFNATISDAGGAMVAAAMESPTADLGTTFAVPQPPAALYLEVATSTIDPLNAGHDYLCDLTYR